MQRDDQLRSIPEIDSTGAVNPNPNAAGIMPRFFLPRCVLIGKIFQVVLRRQVLHGTHVRRQSVWHTRRELQRKLEKRK